MNWDDVSSSAPRGTSHSPQDVRLVLGAFIGPLFFAGGVWLSAPVVSDHIHFDGAPRVNAVVVSVDYDQPGPKESVSSMEVLVPTSSGYESVAVADLATAPDGLSANARVVVLYDPKRSADALFPSQLTWGKVLFRLGFAGIGLLGTVVGVVALVGRTHRTRAVRQ